MYCAREEGWEYRTMALYYNILYLMVRDYRETEAAQEEIQDSRRLDALSKITTYMREHYTEELKLLRWQIYLAIQTLICRECSKSMQKSILRLIYRKFACLMHVGN